MIKKRWYILFSVIIYLDSCTQKSPVYVLGDKEIEATFTSSDNDSVLWGSQISCLANVDNNLYIADNHNDRIITWL